MKLAERSFLVCLFMPVILGTSGGYAQESIRLAWNPIPDPDLAYYTMYRDIIPGTMAYHDSIPRVASIYEDSFIESGMTYYYKITATDSAGNESLPSNEVMVKAATITYADDLSGNTVREFTLGQNYPNPFNPSTTIEYQVPNETKVRIVVYDLLGQEIRRLVDGYQTAGTYQIVWDGRNESGVQMSTGVYFYQMIAGDFAEVRKTALAK